MFKILTFVTYTCTQILRQVNAGDVVLTQVVLSHSGRMLFVGTSSGTVRAVKFPLTEPGEWQEHQAHCAPVSRVRCIPPTSPPLTPHPHVHTHIHTYVHTHTHTHTHVQMRISYDDQFLFSVGQDGSLFAFKVHDKDGRTLKREKDVPFAEEVLVTKSDLEEKVKTCVHHIRTCGLK